MTRRDLHRDYPEDGASRSRCREPASGYLAAEEVIAADVANGPAESDARTLTTSVRDTFCPAVKPASHAAPTSSPSSSTPPSDRTRGLMGSVAYLDASFPAASVAACAAVVGEPFGEPRAYVLPGGQLLCGDFLPDSPWDEHFINFDVVLPAPVSVEQALPVITALLPTDIGPPDTRDGQNPPSRRCPGLA
jgi:hypothetical protein